MDPEQASNKLTPRQAGGMVWAKYVAKWVVIVAASGLFLVLLAVPFGLTMVILLPIAAVVLVVAGLYTVWRKRAVRLGDEEGQDAEYVELVGGREAHERRGDAARTDQPSHV